MYYISIYSLVLYKGKGKHILFIAKGRTHASSHPRYFLCLYHVFRGTILRLAILHNKRKIYKSVFCTRWTWKALIRSDAQHDGFNRSVFDLTSTYRVEVVVKELRHTDDYIKSDWL